ncbi:Uncharacterised protein [Klebsiella pneumoniae]|nr:Uncharacterised protein [Klebsiella pneumoniae]
MLKLARLPVFRQIIIVGVVLKSAAGRAVDIPEVGRGDRMAAGTDKRAPRVFIHRNAAADHFMNIPYGKRDVV